MSDASKCFDYALSVGVKVVSCSYGGGDGLPTFLQTLERVSQAGMFVVASAGNNQRDNDQTPVYPSNYATEYSNLNMLSVTGYTKDHNLVQMCNYGARELFSHVNLFLHTLAGSVMVGAPGSLVYTTERGSTYTLRLGSSPASPNIAGIIALGLATNPSISGMRMKQLLQASVEPVPQLQGKTVWGGKINAYTFLLLAQME